MTCQIRTSHTSVLRAASRTTCEDPLEDRYIELVIAIFKRARADLRHPGYRASAVRWLHSPHAAHYADLLGVNLNRLNANARETRS
jgi:hypothetical protein